jgi:hypothetical protein
MSFSSSSSSSYSLSTHASRLRNWLAFAGFIFETIFGLTRLMLAILVSSLGINFWQWGSGCFNHFLFKYQVSILCIYNNATTQGGGMWTKEKTRDHGPTFVDIDAKVSMAGIRSMSRAESTTSRSTHRFMSRAESTTSRSTHRFMSRAESTTSRSTHRFVSRAESTTSRSHDWQWTVFFDAWVNCEWPVNDMWMTCEWSVNFKME